MGLKTTNYLESMKMVEKCRNQRKLAKIAETTKFRNVWEAAVDKITDQKILYRLSLNRENTSAACRAVRKLTDQIRYHLYRECSCGIRKESIRYSSGRKNRRYSQIPSLSGSLCP